MIFEMAAVKFNNCENLRCVCEIYIYTNRGNTFARINPLHSKISFSVLGMEESHHASIHSY